MSFILYGRMSYSHKWIGNDIIFSFTGEVSYDDINEANNEIYGDSRFDSMNYAIFDFSLIVGFALSENEVEIISAMDRAIARWNRKLKLALIGKDKEVKNTIISYIHLMDTNLWDIKLFDHIEEAIEWCLEK